MAGLGGFFTYVNKQRLQHVENYLKEHPDATLQEAVLESGFNSRQTYYSVKSKL
ncbi:MAG: helix-turn-helix domain-containing protein [Bacteroidales bacterium]|nr:helix-turn-helix domain-containing protein [Bacteroidales bacterium]